MSHVDKGLFSELLKIKLQAEWERASTVFVNCGKNLSYDVTNVLLHAVDQNKVDEVLSLLEEHYQRHLGFQHPDIRGMVGDALGINPTRRLFNDICVRVLQLTPTT